MKRGLLAVMLAFAVPAAGIAAPAPPSSPAASAAELRPGDYVTGSWELYRSKFVTEEGRVVDDDNGMISHSEGQGYGMLIAVAANDRASFERIWGWTKRELFVRNDALAAWKWDPAAEPHVSDRNDATDGDLLIAWALLRASVRWNVRDHRRQAREIVDDVVDLATADSAFGRVLLPAAEGFSGASQPDAPVVNLSYWVLPALSELKTISAKLDDADLQKSGLALIEAARFGPAGLPTDWIGLGGKTPQPAANFPPQYGYNAVRVPLYLAWSSAEPPVGLEPFADAWNAGGAAVPRAIDVATAGTVNAMDGPGYRALAALLACSLHRTETAEAAKRFEPTSYYPSTLHILSLMALSERYPQCL